MINEHIREHLILRVPSLGSLFDSTTPAANGVAASGSSTIAARKDHVHQMPTYADIGTDARFVNSLGATRLSTVFNCSSSGSGSTSSNGIGAGTGRVSYSLSSGLTATGYGRVSMFDGLASDDSGSGTGIDCSKSYDFSCIMKIGYDTGPSGIVRILIGAPFTGTPPAGNANGLADLGWGAEIRHTAGGGTEMRVVTYSAGAFTGTAWVAVTLSSPTPIRILKTGAIVTAYVATTPYGEIPSVATITSGSTAPTTGISAAGKAIVVYAVSDGSGSGNQGFCWLAPEARLRIY